MQLDIKKREPSKGFQTLHIHHKENSLPPQIQAQPKRVKEEKEKKKQYSLSDFQILTTLGISFTKEPERSEESDWCASKIVST